MKSATPPPFDSKILDEFRRDVLAREAERNELKAKRAERRRGRFAFAALLLLTLLLYLFFRWCDAHAL
jgi:nitrogen fixation/metabolism regulation signal transduction histidine kinase